MSALNASNGHQDAEVTNNVINAARDEESENWILLEDGALKGLTLVADKDSGDIVCLSSRNCSDLDRRTVMPSLKDYSSLKVVDLDGYRYVTTLDESIGDVTELRRLSLTRCSLLKTLPSSIGNLQNLTEVSGEIRNRAWSSVKYPWLTKIWCTFFYRCSWICLILTKFHNYRKR